MAPAGLPGGRQLQPHPAPACPGPTMLRDSPGEAAPPSLEAELLALTRGPGVPGRLQAGFPSYLFLLLGSAPLQQARGRGNKERASERAPSPPCSGFAARPSRPPPRPSLDRLGRPRGRWSPLRGCARRTAFLGPRQPAFLGSPAFIRAIKTNKGGGVGVKYFWSAASSAVCFRGTAYGRGCERQCLW